MFNMKKVILVGATMVVVVGCNVFAASGDKFSFNDNGMKKRDFKEKYSNSIDVKNSESSGDTFKMGKGKFKKAKFKNLTEEEKTELKEKRESEKANKKEKFENLTEEEKAALKEKKGAEKASGKEKFENLTDEQKEAFKANKCGKKGHKFPKKDLNVAQEVTE